MLRAPGDTNPAALLQIEDFETEDDAKFAAKEIESKRNHTINEVLKDGDPWLNRLDVIRWLKEK